MNLLCHQITAANFAPYGTLVTTVDGTGSVVNEGRGLRFETDANLVHRTATTQPKLALYKIEGSQWPIKVRMLERHCHSAQLFLSMAGGLFLVVVARALGDGKPDIDSLAAFVCAQGQGIVYAPGVWHLPLVAIDLPADFAMIMWENGTPEDCEEHLMAITLSVHPPQGAEI